MKLREQGMVPFLTAHKIQELVKTIAQDIKRKYPKEHLHLICPLKGSIIFLTDLSRHLDCSSVTIDFVKVKSKGKSFIIEKDVHSDLNGKTVIIVEEIIDAGRSLSFLKNHLLLSYPKSVEIACLLDKPARREMPISPDYTGKTIDDRYVIGYGLDSDEVGRNYTDIYNFLQ